MKKRFLIFFAILFSFLRASAQSEVHFLLKKDTLTISNSRIVHRYFWNEGNIQLIELIQKENKESFKTQKLRDDVFFARESGMASRGHLEIVNDHSAQIIYHIHDLEVSRTISLYPESDLVHHQFAVRGKASAAHWSQKENGELKMVEKNAADKEVSRIGHLSFTTQSFDFQSVFFREATDYHDQPVQVNTFRSFSKKEKIKGNLLNAKEENKALVIIKEAPITDTQAHYSGYDFSVDFDGISIHNIGIEPQDIHADEWTSGYGYALGIIRSDVVSLSKAILEHQKERARIPFMILANTWGDRSKDSRMTESFIKKEIDRAALLGITHLQLDDGWQQGISENSAMKTLGKWDDWQAEDWMPHKERFPNGLEPVVSHAHERNISLALWFNPSKKEDYINWERDAETIAYYYKTYGITVFKLDGMQLGNKRAESNLIRFFKKVQQLSDGNVIFNLDVTAGQRSGYHYFSQYGNLFLENRYTDWGNYYPYRTLRNLWLLSRYVPLQRIQAEFLNVDRNTKKYIGHEKFAPQTVGMEYAFATTLFAQPLAWMELSRLDDAHLHLSEKTGTYTSVAPEIQKGVILPVGEEPSGRSWTGFLSLGKEHKHYLIVYREDTKENNFVFDLPFNICNVFAVMGNPHQVNINKGKIAVTLETPWSYVLFEVMSK